MSKPSSSINATAAAAGVSRVKVLMDSACQASPRDIAKHSDGPRRWSTTNILMLATAAYFFLCGAFVASPYLQSTLVYLHIARWPLGDLTNLSRFGLAEARTVTINMNGSDTLEGYHIMPPGRGAIAGAALEGPERDRFFEDLLREASSVVVYLHGNAGTRAHHRRVAVQKHIAAYCNAHVLTFDYRFDWWAARHSSVCLIFVSYVAGDSETPLEHQQNKEQSKMCMLSFHTSRT